MLKDSMNPHFRIATRDDVTAIAELVCETRKWASTNEIQQTVETSSDEELLAETDSQEIYICDDEGTVASFTLLPFSRERQDRFQALWRMLSRSTDLWLVENTLV